MIRETKSSHETRCIELADAAVVLLPGDARFREVSLQAAHNAMGVAQQANDLPTQHRALNPLIELAPEDTGLVNALAWLLATFPDLTLRDPARAVQLARKAVVEIPGDPDFQSTLRAALDRMGGLEVAIPTLDRLPE